MANQKDDRESIVRTAQEVVRLTGRQTEVLRLAGHGLSGKQIARHLGISVRTVEDHFTAMRQRTGTHTLGELVAYGAAAGFIELRLPPRDRGPGKVIANFASPE